MADDLEEKLISATLGNGNESAAGSTATPPAAEPANGQEGAADAAPEPVQPKAAAENPPDNSGAGNENTTESKDNPGQPTQKPAADGENPPDGNETPTPAAGEKPAPESSDDSTEPDPEEKSVMDRLTNGYERLECPYCGQTLEEHIINGKTWFYHDLQKIRYKCSARFLGEESLAEAQKQTLILLRTEEEEKAAEKRAKEEEQRKAKEEEERKAQAEKERPIRETAEKIGEVILRMMSESLEKVHKSEKDSIGQVVEPMKQRYEEQLTQMEARYAELLKQKEEEAEKYQNALQDLLDKTEGTIRELDRNSLSTAITTYQSKENNTAEDDPNQKVYQYFCNSYNELLKETDKAKQLISNYNAAATAAGERLKTFENEVKEKIQDLSPNDKEYNDFIKGLENAKLGILNRLEIELHTLERFYFRRF